MVQWEMFSYVGLAFAVVYRVPQIAKIYRSKRADDLSAYSCITHNGAYTAFIIYLVGTGKTRAESVLFSYYLLGFTQNLVICCLKAYYSRNQLTNSENGGEVC